MNNKGFTMVELLVAVAILGIITGISIPLLRGIQASQVEKKYTTYLDNMSYAAKLYTDSYSEDLYGNHTNGCAIISYEDLARRNLIKDIDISDMSCNSEYSLVKVVKYNNKYYYKPFAGCGTKENGTAKNPDIFRPTKAEISDICSASSDQIIGIVGVPDKDDSITNKGLAPRIELISETGINKANPPRLYYGYSYTKEPKIIGGKWNKVDFKIPTKNQQEPLIRQAKPQNFLSRNTLPTPPSETGDLYLVIRVDILEDLDGNNWRDKEDNYVYLGPYRVDNTPPVFNTSTIKSSESTYQSIKPQLNFNVTDNYSKDKDLKICYAYENDEECKDPIDSKNLESLKSYEAYSKNKVLRNISKTYDGKVHPIKIVISDVAGNIARQGFNYKISKSYKLTFNTDGGNTCVPESIQQIENKAWIDPTIKDSVIGENVLCVPKKNGYNFKGWFTEKNGKGEQLKESNIAKKDLTVYAKWDSGNIKCTAGYYLPKSKTSCTTCPKNSYCQGGNYKYSTTADQGLNTCPGGYGNTDSTGKSKITDCYMNVSANYYVKTARASSSTQCPSGYIKEAHRVYYNNTSSCSVVNYTITYDLNGGTATGNNPTNYNVNSSNIKLANPTRSGYVFTGWTGSNGTEKNTNVTISSGSTGNRSYTAHWYDECSTNNSKWNEDFPSDSEIIKNGRSTSNLVTVTTQKWKTYSKSCSGKNPLRVFKFTHVMCRCKIDKKTNKFCGSVKVRDVTSITHQGGKANIYYRDTKEGRMACDGNITLNSYVEQVCTKGILSDKKTTLLFHGYKFFWNKAEAPYNQFYPNDYWTHNTDINNRVASSASQEDACKKACSVNYK